MQPTWEPHRPRRRPYVINGRKWVTTEQPTRVQDHHLMGNRSVTPPTASPPSMVPCPNDTPGSRCPARCRSASPACLIGIYVVFVNVLVPLCKHVAWRGRGFEIAAGRLGPDAIHHASAHRLRASGCWSGCVADRAARRLRQGLLAEQTVNLWNVIAHSRIMDRSARLLTLKAGAHDDYVGNNAARQKSR